MIAQAGPAIAAGVLYFSVLAGGLAVLVWALGRAAAGRPPLDAHPRPFADVDPTQLLLVAAVFFLGSQLLLSFGGAWGAALSLAGAVAVHRRFLRRLLLPRGSRAWRVAVGLLAVWAALPVLLGLHLALRALGLGELQPQVEQIQGRKEGWAKTVFLAVAAAPVLEEVFFRGMLYPALRRMAGRFVALGVSSAVFGLLHLPPDVWAPLAVLGAVLAYLAETTGSLLPCIAAHAAFNGFTVAQSLLQPGG